MDAAVLRAVVDTLLPGDEVLPSGTAGGVGLAPGAHAVVLEAIAARAGGGATFASATAAQRAEMVTSFAATEPAAFRALLMTLLQDYCESGKVLAALGWPSAPPQPAGYRLAPMDDDTRHRLETVKRRGPIWRRC